MGRTGIQTSGQKRDYLDRILHLKAVKIRGIAYPRLQDLLGGMGKHFPVEEVVVELKRQHLVEVSSAGLYRWRRELFGSDEAKYEKEGK